MVDRRGLLSSAVLSRRRRRWQRRGEGWLRRGGDQRFFGNVEDGAVRAHRHLGDDHPRDLDLRHTRVDGELPRRRRHPAAVHPARGGRHRERFGDRRIHGPLRLERGAVTQIGAQQRLQVSPQCRQLSP